ncbi:hypothetical protein NDU88_007942 [Pleurodeles waltl]|uniref:Uncharacterized protein n=1 Tax=Pleurodeles waltl TaxID=8319 RepID=A0AAV7NUR3_PLEWA|nr:hypothetical protein NDU88_007942 [Pleurodeles waltl]
MDERKVQQQSQRRSILEPHSEITAIAEPGDSSVYSVEQNSLATAHKLRQVVLAVWDVGGTAAVANVVVRSKDERAVLLTQNPATSGAESKEDRQKDAAAVEEGLHLHPKFKICAFFSQGNRSPVIALKDLGQTSREVSGSVQKVLARVRLNMNYLSIVLV